jgi:hypothetical protein
VSVWGSPSRAERTRRVAQDQYYIGLPYTPPGYLSAELAVVSLCKADLTDRPRAAGCQPTDRPRGYSRARPATWGPSDRARRWWTPAHRPGRPPSRHRPQAVRGRPPAVATTGGGTPSSFSRSAMAVGVAPPGRSSVLRSATSSGRTRGVPMRTFYALAARPSRVRCEIIFRSSSRRRRAGRLRTARRLGDREHGGVGERIGHAHDPGLGRRSVR